MSQSVSFAKNTVSRSIWPTVYFGSMNRHFSSDHRVVYVYRACGDKPHLSGVNPEYEKALFNTFKKYAHSEIRSVNTQELKQALDKKQKAVLAIPGGHAVFLSDELSSLIPVIRKKIHAGDLNYFGICSGAIFAGHGLEANSSEPIRIYSSYLLCLANFRSAGFPYPASGRLYKGESSIQSAWIDQEGNKFKAHWNSGPCLQVTEGKEITDLKAKSTLQIVAKFSDEFFLNVHGNAALKGTYGSGRFYVFSYHPEKDDDLEGPSAKHLEKAIKYVLGSDLLLD